MGSWVRAKIGIELIGGFKVVKALLLLLSAPFVHFIGRHQMAFLYALVLHLSVDPHARYFQAFVRRLVEISPKFPLISVGMSVYGALFLVEGVGLLLRKRWAEYLTVIVTGSFLPLEFYEMIHRSSVAKGIVILVNLAILGYLLFRLHAERKEQRVNGMLIAANST